MKIDVNQIPQEGLTLSQEFTPQELDLETDIVKFSGSVGITAGVTKITNAVTVDLHFEALMQIICGRCLNEFQKRLKKDITLNFDTNSSSQRIDLDPDIREEIILDYPLKPLCKIDCKGICPKCGRNLNEEKCSC